VENGKNGFTCQAGDTESFYQSTRRLVMDKMLRKQMGIVARESAKNFDRQIILQQMLDHYKVSS
jgi:hypothetical protein